MMSMNTYQALASDKLVKAKTRLESYGGHKLSVDVTPVVYSARKVPHRLRDQLNTELDKMVEDGIIEAVTVPTEWVSSLVLVMKPGGKIRICLDPSSLNEAIKREHYAIPTADEIFARLHGSTYFSTLDATSGFLQMKLDEESSYKTTFASPYTVDIGICDYHSG